MLCDGPTFSAGDSCQYNCQFCYAFPLMAHAKGNPDVVKSLGKEDIREVAIRRKNPAEKIRSQLLTAKGEIKYTDPNDTRVIYASPLVDVAANMELCRETIEICQQILELTHWQIRLLSKSNLLPKIAQALESHRDRMIFGVSTGTANDGIAKSFERGTPLVSKRIQSLHVLQDQGFRTFGMICPSLPRPNKDYAEFSQDICKQIRINHPTMEETWAEVINVRGDSLTATSAGLQEGGYHEIAEALEAVSGNQAAWEEYNQETFLGHTEVIPPAKLRYLTYVTPKTKDWWKQQVSKGAVLLGKGAES